MDLGSLMKSIYPADMEQPDPAAFRRHMEAQYGGAKIFKDRSHERPDFAQRLLQQMEGK